VFRRTVPPSGSDPADYVLEGFASELYGDLRDAAKPIAAIAITYYLSPSNALSPNVVWTREYRQRARGAARQRRKRSPRVERRAFGDSRRPRARPRGRDLPK
jgi:hypothetical protein